MFLLIYPITTRKHSQMKLLFLIITSLLLISCDPETSYEQIIENQSSHAIWLFNDGSTVFYCGDLKDSVLLPSKQSLVLRNESGLGSPFQYEACTELCPIDTIKTSIATNNNLSLNYPLDANANWEYTELSNKSYSYKCECRLVITDSDIN